jgi:arginine/ornithine N-succinyltransferase beta subunit
MSNFDLLWNEQQQKAASAEGWLLAVVVNAGTSISTAYLDIFDTGPRFKSRTEAMRFVVAQAQQRSRLHIDALSACSASKLATSAPPSKRKKT